MSQLQLFDPSQCIAYGEQLKELLLTEALPGLRQKNEGERLAVGACSRALALVGEDRAHPDFQRFRAALHKTGEPVDECLGKIPAYRFATDPKTAGLVAHLPALSQVQGYMNQLALGKGEDEEDLLVPSTPNQAPGPIDFKNLSHDGPMPAHLSGQLGEDGVEVVMTRLGIDYSSQFPATFIGWGKKEACRPDFKVAPFNVDPLQRGFYIEVKWRNRQTNVDDALVALLHNIEAWYDLPTLIVYDGVGATRRTYDMVCHQMEQKRRRLGDKVLALMTLAEFHKFALQQLGKQRRGLVA